MYSSKMTRQRHQRPPDWVEAEAPTTEAHVKQRVQAQEARPRNWAMHSISFLKTPVPQSEIFKVYPHTDKILNYSIPSNIHHKRRTKLPNPTQRSTPLSARSRILLAPPRLSPIPLQPILPPPHRTRNPTRPSRLLALRKRHHRHLPLGHNPNPHPRRGENLPRGMVRVSRSSREGSFPV